MDMLAIIEQWGIYAAIIVTMVGGFTKFANQLATINKSQAESLATVTTTMKNLNASWAIAHEREQQESGRMANQQVAQYQEVIRLTGVVAGETARRLEMEKNYEKEAERREASHENERSAWADERAELRKELESLKGGVTRLEANNKTLEAKIDKLEEINTGLLDERDDCYRQLQQSKKKLEEVTGQRDNAVGIIAKRETTIEQLQAKLKECQEEKEEKPKEDTKPIFAEVLPPNKQEKRAS